MTSLYNDVGTLSLRYLYLEWLYETYIQSAQQFGVT